MVRDDRTNASAARWQVGEAIITKVVELEASSWPRFLFGDAFDESRFRSHKWLSPHYIDERGKLKGSIHCFIIESKGCRIAVDTCLGNDKPRLVEHWHMRQGSFLQDLVSAGFPPETIDVVVCTHLHVDHVGWNTRWQGGRWVPTFPNARYLIGQKEWDHWRQNAGAEGLIDHRQVLADSVQPIFDAGLAQLVDDDYRITEEVSLEPTPGHTPGHVSVKIASNGSEAAITGDLMHHPVQCCEPDLCSLFDGDPALARLTRRSFLESKSRRGALVLGTHFPNPTAGWLISDEDNWKLSPNPPKTFNGG